MAMPPTMIPTWVRLRLVLVVVVVAAARLGLSPPEADGFQVDGPWQSPDPVVTIVNMNVYI